MLLNMYPFGLVLALRAQYDGLVVDLTPKAYRRVLPVGQLCWAIPDTRPDLVLWLSSMFVLVFFCCSGPCRPLVGDTYVLMFFVVGLFDHSQVSWFGESRVPIFLQASQGVHVCPVPRAERRRSAHLMAQACHTYIHYCTKIVPIYIVHVYYRNYIHTHEMHM